MKENEKYPEVEKTSLDEFFRNSLKDYQVAPPARVWNKISRRLLIKELLQFNFTNFPKKSSMVLIAGFSLIVALLFFLKFDDQEILSAGNNPAISQTPDNHASSLKSEVKKENFSPSPSSPEMISSAEIIQNEKQTVKSSLKTKYSNVRETQPEKELTSPPAPFISNDVNMRINKISSIEFPFRPGLGDITPVLTAQPKITGFFSANFGVTPLYTSLKQKSSSTGNNFSYWTDLGLTWHYSRFSVKSGISYGYRTDEAKYRVNYRSNDSIGFFTSIISFYVDPSNPTQILFNTKTLTVFDSIDHLIDDRARSRYTYLTIPLLAGFDLLQTNKLIVTLQAGPAFTFLIGTKEARPYIDYPGARIIRVDKDKTVRIKSSWQIQTALHFDYRITKGFSVYAEPSYSYFLNPAYGNDEIPSAKPWSVGLGIGLQYNFGKAITKQRK